MGKGGLATLANVICFHCIAAPLMCLGGLTDWVSESVTIKMIFCVIATTCAQVPLTVFGALYMFSRDWDQIGQLIEERANSDEAFLSHGDDSECIGSCIGSTNNVDTNKMGE